jgi:hypothetical protein
MKSGFRFLLANFFKDSSSGKISFRRLLQQHQTEPRNSPWS